PTRRNNLTSDLLEVASISPPGRLFAFQRAGEGWVFLSATCRGKGAVRLFLDQSAQPVAVIAVKGADDQTAEAMRFVTKGEHQLRVECNGEVSVSKLIVRAIPELMHCGLGFDPAIKSYGKYDLGFLKKDILPNVTTLIVPPGIKLEQAVI